MRHNHGKFSDISILGLTIAPTLNCNFGCEYCFEERQNKEIGKDIEEKIYELAESAASKGKAVGVTWFGGEPMLSFDAIVRMTTRFKEICDTHKVEYSAGMISNGYLFDEKKIEIYKNLSINNVQITLDGPQRIHDQRRYLLNRKPTFSKIIENIKLLLNAKQNVSIRINIDNTNVDEIDKLIQFLKSEGIDSAAISFGHVKAINKTCKTLESSCLTNDLYSQKVREFSKVLEKNELKSGMMYPKLRSVYCSANSTDSFVIDPEGYLYKCWNDIGITEKRSGSLLNRITPEQSAVDCKYVLFSPFENDECTECKYLPICMGGCPSFAIFDGLKSCEMWKYGFEEHMINVYERVSKK